MNGAESDFVRCESIVPVPESWLAGLDERQLIGLRLATVKPAAMGDGLVRVVSGVLAFAPPAPAEDLIVENGDQPKIRRMS